MPNSLRKFLPLLLAAAITSPVLMTGCEVNGRVYDSYDHQYRHWAPESTYYAQWETDNHYRHERYERRSKQEQQEYWKWRHDHDHDHDNH
jgi:hypothetical protein